MWNFDLNKLFEQNKLFQLFSQSIKVKQVCTPIASSKRHFKTVGEMPKIMSEQFEGTCGAC